MKEKYNLNNIALIRINIKMLKNGKVTNTSKVNLRSKALPNDSMDGKVSTCVTNLDEFASDDMDENVPIAEKNSNISAAPLIKSN